MSYSTECERLNIIAMVNAGLMTEHEGFEFYKAMVDNNTSKVEEMRRMFAEREAGE